MNTNDRESFDHAHSLWHDANQITAERKEDIGKVRFRFYPKENPRQEIAK